MTKNTKSKDLFHVNIANGKYTVILPENGGLKALRYGEEWRDCCGDSLILSLIIELDNLRNKIKNFSQYKGCICEDNKDDCIDCMNNYIDKVDIAITKLK